VGTTLAMVVIIPMGISLAVKVWPHTPLGKRIIGAPTQEQVDREKAQEDSSRAQRKALVGKEGIVLTDLRPVGKAEIDGVRYEVLSETVFVPAGSRVRVTSADLEQIKVRPLA
jgi:membrane-bound ClpP family serine protease